MLYPGLVTSRQFCLASVVVRILHSPNSAPKVSTLSITTGKLHSRFAPQGVVEGAGEGEGPARPDVDLVQGEAVLDDGLRHGAALLATALLLLLRIRLSRWNFCPSGSVFLDPIRMRRIALRSPCRPCIVIVRAVAAHVLVRRVVAVGFVRVE